MVLQCDTTGDIKNPIGLRSDLSSTGAVTLETNVILHDSLHRINRFQTRQLGDLIFRSSSTGRPIGHRISTEGLRRRQWSHTV